MKNASNFLHRLRRPSVRLHAAFASLLFVLSVFMASCGKNAKGENIQEVLLKDKTFQEFVTTDYNLKKLWLDGSVRNPSIKTMDPYKLSTKYDEATTEAAKIKTLQDAGYVGDLAKKVELLTKGEAARDRFREKFPNVPEEDVAKAIEIYEVRELGKPDYNHYLKIHKDAKEKN